MVTSRTVTFPDEISGWSAPSPETELELERFFEEMSPPDAGHVAEVEKPHPPPSDLSWKARNDSDEYRLFLKNKLALECVAYALSRESSVEPANLLHLDKNQISKHTQLGVHVEAQVAQTQAHCEPMGSSTLPDMQNKQARPTTSESSREDSDDELERDTETTDNMGPQDAKRARRMRSNRESARRSRRRKQALLSELEEQVEELRKDKNALLQRQDSWNSKYGEATVEHRILNAEIEALRAKVRMSEERVKQASGGYNPFLAMPLVNPDQVIHQPIIPNIANAAPHHQRFGGGFPRNSPVSFDASQQMDGVGHIMAETPAMQTLQKQIGGGANPSQAMPGWNLPQAPINNKRES